MTDPVNVRGQRTSLQGDIDVYRRWAPHVARFSFRTSHLL